MKNKDLPTLLRKAYQNRVNGVEDREIYATILMIIETIARNQGIIKNEDLEEFKQECIYALVQSFDSKNKYLVWKNNLKQDKDSDKILKAYFYAIIKSTKRIVYRVWSHKDKCRLHDVVGEITDDMIKNNILNTVRTMDVIFLYKAKHNEPPLEVQQWVTVPSRVILNPGGTINSDELRKLILDIFNNDLENSRISLSDLVDNISEITGCGNYKKIPIETKEDEQAGYTIGYDKLGDEDSNYKTDLLTDINNMVDIWVKRIQTDYTEKEAAVYAAIYYLHFRCKYTLIEISNLFNKKVSKSTVDNYIKKLIKTMDISKNIRPDDKDFIYYHEALLDRLHKEYNITIEKEG